MFRLVCLYNNIARFFSSSCTTCRLSKKIECSFSRFIIIIKKSKIRKDCPDNGYIFKIMSLSGIQILIFLAALQGISPALYEVAKIEGATGYETFWKVTVVMVSPMIFTCTIYTLADLFMRSDIVELVYTIGFKQSRHGMAAAMSCVFILMNVLVICIAALLIRKVVFYYDD